MTKLDIHSIQKLFKKRLPDSHKGSHGHALLIVGNHDKMGAAIICVKACLRAGAGLVTVNIPKKERLAIFAAIPEAMIEFREDRNNREKYNTVAIGPGIGNDESAKNLLKLVFSSLDLPAVFDADALNILAENQEQLLKLPQKSILTPHVKEFDRLFGKHDSESERRQTAKIKAKELEQIKTVPPTLNYFYKLKISDYFKKLNSAFLLSTTNKRLVMASDSSG